MDRITALVLTTLAGAKRALGPKGEPERADVPGWVLITLMTAALVVLIWGVASERLLEIFNRAMDSLSGI